MKQIRLSKGLFALVDDADFEWLSQWKWHASLSSRGTKWYAVRNERVNGETIRTRMHRVIMGVDPKPTDGMVVDHINHNSLDNRRENLEIVSQTENMRRVPGWRKANAKPKAQAGASEVHDDLRGEQQDAPRDGAPTDSAGLKVLSEV